MRCCGCKGRRSAFSTGRLEQTVEISCLVEFFDWDGELIICENLSLSTERVFKVSLNSLRNLGFLPW
jgi:hypothetical protein